MHIPVMPVAEQSEIRQIGATAVNPVLQVMA
jgi:hypothetical protein